jgi:O-methyltransferase
MTRPVNDFVLPLKIDFPRRYLELWELLSPYTMLSQARFFENLALIQHFGSRLDGSFVECGTWRGGMAAAMIALGGPARTYHFFDSFEGLPPAQARDGADAVAWQADTQSPYYYNNCSATLDEFTDLISRQAVEPGCVAVHKGWFQETVPQHAPAPIAVLRLDGDWYESTMVCLQHLYPRLQAGGIVIIDDYADWDGCARAVHDYLSHTQTAARIERTPFAHVAYLLKTD